jgi:hypothetical protein
MNPEPKTARPAESETEESVPNAEATPCSPADEVQYPFTPTLTATVGAATFPRCEKA